MKKLATVLLTSFLLACGTTSKEPDWTAAVVPAANPVSECTKTIPPAPKPPLKKLDSDESARAYQVLKKSRAALSRDYSTGRRWAKGQEE